MLYKKDVFLVYFGSRNRRPNYMLEYDYILKINRHMVMSIRRSSRR